ncbi:SoxR reducing system RseC family protein [Deltaproteobacteria bacterium TL4]
MSRKGIVVAIKNGVTQVSTSRRGVCGECAEKSGCSFDSAFEESVAELIIVDNPIGAKKGDLVEFDLTGHTELKVSFLIWVVPLIGLLMGAFSGANVHQYFSLSQDISTLIGSFVGFMVAFSFIVVFDRKFANEAKLIPRVLKILPSSNCNEESLK